MTLNTIDALLDSLHQVSVIVTRVCDCIDNRDKVEIEKAKLELSKLDLVIRKLYMDQVNEIKQEKNSINALEVLNTNSDSEIFKYLNEEQKEKYFNKVMENKDIVLGYIKDILDKNYLSSFGPSDAVSITKVKSLINEAMVKGIAYGIARTLVMNKNSESNK